MKITIPSSGKKGVQTNKFFCH